MKLLGDEAKKREVGKYYSICKKVHDLVYYDWRDLKKSYFQLQMAEQLLDQQEPQAHQKLIVDVWKATSKLGSKSPLRVLNHRRTSINEDIQKIESIQKSGQEAKKKGSKKKQIVNQVYAKYLSIADLDFEKEV